MLHITAEILGATSTTNVARLSHRMQPIDSCSQAQRSQIELDTGEGTEAFKKCVFTIFLPGIFEGNGQRKPANRPINFDAPSALS
jgi:hypothetical protein